MISNKVMKTDEFKDGIYYKADCDCGCDEHIVTIEMEFDKEFNDIALNFYKKISWSSHYGDYNWFQRIWNQLKAATKILFTGWIELEESFLIRDEEHINAFIEALEEGKRKLKTNNDQEPQR